MELTKHFQRVRGWIVRNVMGLRSHLPVSARSRRRVKYVLFRYFPFIFRGPRIYLDWLTLNPPTGSSFPAADRSVSPGRTLPRLLVVSHDAQGHGAQLLALSMVRALRQEFEVEVILLLGGGRLKRDFEALVPVHQLNEFGSKVSDVAALVKSLVRRGFRKAIVNSTAAGSIVPVCNEAGVESICLVHELPGIIRGLQLEAQARQIASYAKAVVFPAQIVADGFVQFAHIDSERQVIRPQGLYRNNKWRTRKVFARAELAKQLGLPSGTKVVLAVGRADHRKGVDLFVAIALQILEKRRDVDFVWVGDWDADMRNALESILHESPHKERIHFVGYVADTALYHAGSDVFALTSREDPFPNVVLESFEVGVPVVAFASTGGAASLVERVGGMVAPAQDVVAFSAAICQLLENPGLAATLGDAAQKQIDRDFSFQAYLKDICGLLSVDAPRQSVGAGDDLSLNSPPPLHAVLGKRVLIILAAYNGGKYIAEQIKSIQGQTFADWELLVRDDNSGDDTVRIVQRMAEKDRRIDLLHDESGKLGAIRNFGALMEEALERGADYLFFADQDDVWDPDKLSILLGAMCELEGRASGGHLPLLVHSDLTIVDESLKIVSDSFVKYSGLAPENAGLGLLLCQNQVTGCASAINRRLLELACPLPPQILMHDWWVALLASSVGRVVYVPLQLVSYRQHGKNVLGAATFWSRLGKIILSPRQAKVLTSIVYGSMVQAGLLVDRVCERGFVLQRQVAAQLHAYANLPRIRRFMRPIELHRFGIEKPGRLKRWTFFLMTLLMDDGRKGGTDA